MKMNFSKPSDNLLKNELRKRLMNLSFSKNSLLFVKPDDIISKDYLSSGSHEYGLINFIQHCTTENYSDFFIDIGANIGLISSVVSHSFDEIHLFEPNPVASHILSANTIISGLANKTVIYEIALGKRDEIVDLVIPPKNYGGAFIKSDENMYTSEELFLKDGYEKPEFSGHFIQKVNMVSAEKFLTDLFQDMESRGLKKGVIKIDVEGMEKFIIAAISKALPLSFELVIVYEDWFRKTKKSDIFDIFGNNASLYFLKRKRRYKMNSLISKIFAIILQKIDGIPAIEYELSNFSEVISTEDPSLDMVIFVN